MSEHDTATGEGMPEPKPQKPEPPAKAPTTVSLRLTAPFWCSAYNLPMEDGGTLGIDKKGVEVPVQDADDIIETAAKHGVTITKVSE